jgi:hypothetical protein
MKAGPISRRLSSAIAVRWTPVLAGRVERRIHHRLARRRQRRRVALLALAFLGLAGAAYAFSRPWARQARHLPAVLAQPARSASAPALPEPAPASPELSPVVPDEPTLRAPSSPQPPLHRAGAARHRPPAETVEALLAAADAARLAGRPADAVAPLTAIFTRHARDPRAAIAAYELGRVLSNDLHDRARGAEAFARAHDLDPTGPLAADAAAHAADARRSAREGEVK